MSGKYNLNLTKIRISKRAVSKFVVAALVLPIHGEYLSIEFRLPWPICK